MKDMTTEEFRSSGLLYLANRALHLFGVALAVTVEEDGTVREGLSLVRTDDPVGFTFSEKDEAEGRRRLAAWIRKTWRP